MSHLNYSQTIYLFQESDPFLMQCGHLWHFINNSGSPFLTYKWRSTHRRAWRQIRLSRRCLFFFFFSSTGRASVTWNYLAAEITRDEARTRKEMLAGCWERACQPDGEGRKKRHRGGSKKQLLYWLRPTFFFCTMWRCVCVCSLVCAAPDQMYSKVMVPRLRRESVISQTYSLGNL